MIYSQNVIQLFFDTRHAGMLDCTQSLTVCSHINTASNQIINLYIACDTARYIQQACFQTTGNPYLIAGLEWLCRWLKNQPIDIHPCLDYHIIITELEIPTIHYPTAILIDTSYRAAINLMNSLISMESDKNHE